MQLRYSVDISGPQARFASIGTQAAGYERILKRWGGFFKSQALKRADAAEGWPPLSEAYRAKLQHTRTSKVTAHGGVRASYGSALERHLIREQQRAEAKKQYAWASGRAAEGLAGTSSVRAATRGNPSADLQELRRLQAGGRVERAVGKGGRVLSRPAAWQGSKAIGRLRAQVLKAQRQLDERKRQIWEDRMDGERRAGGYQKVTAGGDKRKAASHKMLGRVARQIQWDVHGASVSAYSKIPFSAVHNAGGAAGHGATEPERTFLEIRDSDTLELSKIVLDHMLGGSAAA